MRDRMLADPREMDQDVGLERVFDEFAAARLSQKTTHLKWLAVGQIGRIPRWFRKRKPE